MGLMSWITGRPSKDEFAKLAIKRLRRAGEDQLIAYDPANFALTVGEGDKPSTMFLHNAYNHYLAAPRLKRSAVLNEFVMGSQVPEMPESWEQVKPLLRPRVRDRFYHWAMPRQLELAGHDSSNMVQPVLRPICEHLNVELAVDTEHSIATFDRERLEEWGIDEDAAFAAARDNLWSVSNDDFLQPQPGVYVSPWRDNWDASRLFLHDLIWQLKVKGLPVAAVPSRDVLIVTGSEDAQGLQAMASLAEETINNDPRPSTPAPVILEDGVWRPFVAPADHPAAAAIDRLNLIARVRDYEEQKQILNALHESNGTDIFVASCMVAERESTGQLFTYSVWSRGVPTQLPITDFLAFNPNPDGKHDESLMVPWSQAHAIVESLMQPEDLYPPRLRVELFPDDSQMQKLLELDILTSGD